MIKEFNLISVKPDTMEVSSHVIVAILLLLGGGSATFLQDSRGVAHFSKEGKVVLARDRADVVLDWDLETLQKDLKATCEAARELTKDWSAKNNKVKLVNAVSQSLSVICSQDNGRWKILLDVATGALALTENQDGGVTHYPGRGERFVVVALLSALVGGVAGAIWNEAQTHAEIERLAAAHNRVIHVVDGLAHRLQVSERHQHLVELALTKAIVGNMIAAERTALVLSLMQSQDRELTRLEGVLQHILDHKTVPAQAFVAGQMSRIIKAIDRDAKKKGLVSLVTTEMDLLKCQASFGTFMSHLVRVVIHIPLAAEQDVFTLMKYVPVPSGANASTGLVSVVDKEALRYLAVNLVTGQHFTPDDEEIHGMFRLQAYSYVFSERMVWEPTHRSCLYSLFMGQTEMVHELCATMAVDISQIKAWRVARSWLICGNDLLTMNCRTKTGMMMKREKLEGCKLVEVEPMCLLKGKSLTIAGTRHASTAEIVMTVPSLDWSQMLNRTETTEQLVKRLMSSNVTGRPTQLRPLSHLVDEADQLQPVYLDWGLPMWMMIALGMIGGTLMIIGFLLCCRRWRTKREARFPSGWECPRPPASSQSDTSRVADLATQSVTVRMLQELNRLSQGSSGWEMTSSRRSERSVPALSNLHASSTGPGGAEGGEPRPPHRGEGVDGHGEGSPGHDSIEVVLGS